MGVNPVRFAVAVSGGLACLMLGLLAGVSAGSSQTGHVMSVETVTTTARAQMQAAVDRTVTVGGKVRTEAVAAEQLQQANAAVRTVTETVTRTVTGDPATVTETVAAPPPPGPAGPGHHHHHHGPGPGDGPGPGGPGDGTGGGDGGGDGG